MIRYLAAAVVLMAAAAACGGNGTVRATGAGGSSSPCGSLLLGAPACHACIAANCCSQLLACDVATPCGQFYDCSINCRGDAHCVTACGQKFPAGSQAFDALINCQEAPCNDVPECHAAPDGVCDSGLALPTLDPYCTTCLATFCCADSEACAADASCKQCFEATSPPPACGPTYAALLGCRSMYCAGACP